MKKAGQLLAVLTAASVLLSGCEKLKDVTTTSVYVSKNGVVTEAIVEDYSKDDDYTEDELKVFVEDDIKKFQRSAANADSVEAGKMPDQRGQGGDPDGIRRLPVLRGLSRSRIFRRHAG